MTNLRLFFIYCLCVVLVTSCCKKEKCLSFSNSPADIEYVNFTLTELDSLTLIIRNKNSGQTVDTAVIYVSATNDPNKCKGSQLFSTDYKYDFKLKTGAIYHIENIKTATEECNNCDDHYDYLASYTVNGKSYNSRVFMVEK